MDTLAILTLGIIDVAVTMVTTTVGVVISIVN